MTQGKTVGYIRVSSFDQNTDRQLEGIKLDKTFIDKVSGKDVNRLQLQAMLEYIREDDEVVVHSMDRLARNVRDLHDLVQRITEKRASLRFVKESLCFTGEDAPLAKLLLSVMGGVAEFERAIIKERQREGIALAKKRGAYKGRSPALSQDQISEILKRVGEGIPKTKIARDFKISRRQIYNYLERRPHD